MRGREVGVSNVAAIQMCSSDHVDDNLATAARLVAQAAANGTQLVVLPEMFVMLGHDSVAKVAIKEAMGEGKIQMFLAALAREHQVWIVAGTIPITCAHPHKIRAACLVFNHEGDVVARYDKRHLFDVRLSTTEWYHESATTEAGDEVVVVNTPFGRLGLCVCFDLRFPEHFEKLIAQGAEIIAVPAAFTMRTGVAHWTLLMRARAVDTFCYLIGACQGGAHGNDRHTYGHSMIVHPWGNIEQELVVPGPGIAYAEINLNQLHAIRQQLPILAG